MAETLVRVIQRADELAEFVAIYWADGRRPLSAQVKKGLAAAFTSFDEYALAKYDRASAVRLRDVLFLTHAKPLDADQATGLEAPHRGRFATPDTWEVAVSSGGDKRAHWERLLIEHRLGRPRAPAQPSQHEGRRSRRGRWSSPRSMPCGRTVSSRSASSLRRVTRRSGKRLWSAPCSLIRRRARSTRLAGHTVVLVDVSGSMVAPLSRRSEMLRTDAAYGLAVLLREIAEKVSIYTFSNAAKLVPPRRGFALRDAMESSQPHQGTYLGAALNAERREAYDRLIVITDEQSHDRVGAPRGKGYMINVASARNGVGYGPWVHIDGFSEAVIEYIRELERYSTYEEPR